MFFARWDEKGQRKKKKEKEKEKWFDFPMIENHKQVLNFNLNQIKLQSKRIVNISLGNKEIEEGEEEREKKKKKKKKKREKGKKKRVWRTRASIPLPLAC